LLAVLARRWSLSILEALEAGALRHNEIRTAVSGVADKVLVETLRVLEAEALVTRTVYAEVPLRVEYRLTDAGQALPAALGPLNEWAELCRRQSCPQ
jgi:DNA-binding HxlR family transcriptional regulator